MQLENNTALSETKVNYSRRWGLNGKRKGDILMTQGLEKLKMAEAFMVSAEFLEFPLHYQNKGDSAEEIEARINDQRRDKKKVCHFLYALFLNSQSR